MLISFFFFFRSKFLFNSKLDLFSSFLLILINPRIQHTCICFIGVSKDFPIETSSKTSKTTQRFEDFVKLKNCECWASSEKSYVIFRDDLFYGNREVLSYRIQLQGNCFLQAVVQAFYYLVNRSQKCGPVNSMDILLTLKSPDLKDYILFDPGGYADKVFQDILNGPDDSAPVDINQVDTEFLWNYGPVVVTSFKVSLDLLFPWKFLYKAAFPWFVGNHSVVIVGCSKIDGEVVFCYRIRGPRRCFSQQLKSFFGK